MLKGSGVILFAILKNFELAHKLLFKHEAIIKVFSGIQGLRFNTRDPY